MKKLLLLGIVLILLSSFVMASDYNLLQPQTGSSSFQNTGTLKFVISSDGTRYYNIDQVMYITGNAAQISRYMKIKDITETTTHCTSDTDTRGGSENNYKPPLVVTGCDYNLTPNTDYVIEITQTTNLGSSMNKNNAAFSISNGTYTVTNLSTENAPWTYDGHVTANGKGFLVNVTEGTIYAENFELTAKNIYNDSSILNFAADITNTTSTTTIYTNNGTIYYPIITELVNISVYNVSGNTYFNRSYTDYNVSTNLDSEHTQAYVNLIMTNLANTTTYTGVNWTITNTDENISENIFINDGITTMTTFNATSGDYNYTAQKDGYPEATGTFSLTALDNKTVYAEVGFFATLNLFDEATQDPFNISLTNSTHVTVVCEDIGSYEYDLDNSTENITISCEYTKLRFTIEYDDTVYTRNILSSETDIFDQDVYLIDLTTTQSIYNAFIVNDYTGEYDNPSLYVKKNIEGTQVVIHSDELDIENKMSVYLIENDEYVVELHSDNHPTEVLGFYGSDVAGTKEITVTTSNIDISNVEIPGTGVFVYSYAKNVSDDLFAYAVYSDIETLTTEITWTLLYLNETNESIVQFYEVTSTGDYGDLSFTAQNITDYRNNTVFSGVTYIKDGTRYVYYQQINDEEENKRKDTAFGYYTIAAVQWGAIIFLSVLALSGTIRTQNMLNYIIIGTAGVFIIFNMMNVSIILLILGLVINFIYNLKTSEEMRVAR